MTVRAPYLSDTERRRWLAYLPDQPIAEELPTPLLQRFLNDDLDGAPADAAMPALAPATLPLAPADIAAIGARIALGYTKTAVVRAMPGYDTRRHREFAAYYDRIAADLAAQGLTARRARDGAFAGISEA